MKTLYLTSNGANICLDKETESAEMIKSEREAIQKVYLAKEPMHVVYTAGEYRREFDVDTNDLIITFYTDDFENRIVAVKNEDWAHNLIEYNKKEEERKLKWAEEKGCCKCEACPCSNPA